MNTIDRKAMDEWLETCIADCSASASDYDMGMKRAFEKVRKKIQSGAFDVPKPFQQKLVDLTIQENEKMYQQEDDGHE